MINTTGGAIPHNKTVYLIIMIPYQKACWFTVFSSFNSPPLLLQLYQDDNLDVTTYTVLILEKSSVQISDLSPGTAYLFRVQALSPEGSPGESSIEDEFETLTEGKEDGHISG